MNSKKTFREFLVEPHEAHLVNGDFELRARDAYELYSYIWDTLRFRQGGIWNFWKKMPLQTYSEMADDWAEANPKHAHLSGEFFSPEIIRQLGFELDGNGRVSF